MLELGFEVRIFPIAQVEKCKDDDQRCNERHGQHLSGIQILVGEDGEMSHGADFRLRVTRDIRHDR